MRVFLHARVIEPFRTIVGGMVWFPCMSQAPQQKRLCYVCAADVVACQVLFVGVFFSFFFLFSFVLQKKCGKNVLRNGELIEEKKKRYRQGRARFVATSRTRQGPFFSASHETTVTYIYFFFFTLFDGAPSLTARLPCFFFFFSPVARTIRTLPRGNLILSSSHPCAEVEVR